MKLYVKKGQVLTLTAPSGGVVSGTAYLIGTVLVVATESVAQTLPFEALVLGVVDLPKPADEIWTENEKLYWDNSAKKITSTASANTLVGVAVAPIAASLEITSDALASDLEIDGAVLTVLDFAALADAVITVKIGSTITVLTEGVDFDAETDDETTANNIATAIAALAGATTSVDTDNAEVTVFPGTGATALNPAVGRVRLDGATR